MPCAVAEPLTSGQEAFVPPVNFAEFLDRHSTLVRWWLVKRMKCPADLVEDYEQSLYVHLMGRSANMAEAGIVDRVATYVAERSGGAKIKNERSVWMAYVCDKLLRNEYIKLVKRNTRGGTRGDNVISLPSGEEVHRMLNPYCSETLGMTPGQYEDFRDSMIQESHGTHAVSREFWLGFISFVDDHDPEITPMLRALEDFDTLAQIREHLEIDEKTYKRYRKVLVRLMREYRTQGRLY